MSNALKKILVVDDEKEVLDYISHILKRANYEVIATTKGREAIDLASKSKPDLIILDIILTDMDGSDVASSLSSDPSTENIPILFLTGVLKKKEESFVEKTGKSYVIAKPVTAPELLRMVSKILPS